MNDDIQPPSADPGCNTTAPGSAASEGDAASKALSGPHRNPIRRPVLVAMTIALLSIAIASGTWLAWSTIRTYAAWGEPLVDERFDDASWKGRWAERIGGDSPGGWEVRGGRLVTTADYDSYLVFRQRLNAPVAIEYTARFERDVRPGDLSVWWCEGEALALEPGKEPFSQPGWFLQAGAYENTCCSIRQVPGSIRAAVANHVLAPGADHVIRVEIDAGRMAMSIDGTEVVEHTGIFPATSGNLALYGYFPGKAFSRIRIWQREMPELVSPLVIGDAACRAGRLADAVEDYRRVAGSHAGSALGARARFLQGLTMRRLGDRTGARRVWQGLPDGDLRRSTECLEVDDLAETGPVRLAADRFIGLWSAGPRMHRELRQRWQEVGQMLRNRRPVSEADLRLWCEVRERCFAADAASAWLGADMLLAIGAWEEVLRRFPDEHRPVALALLSLGRADEVLAAPWSLSHERVWARMAVGDLAGALQSADTHRDGRIYALCKAGRAEEALLLGGAEYPALLYLGRTDELLAQPRFASRHAEFHLLAGRTEEAAAAGSMQARILLGRFEEAERAGFDVRFPRLVRLLADGRIAEARELRPQVTGNRDAQQHAVWFGQSVGLGLVDAALGDTAALRTALQRGATQDRMWGGRQALVCRAVLDPAADAGLAAMAWRTEAVAWGRIALAIRAELASDRTAAFTAWREYAALPCEQRLLHGHGLNLEVEAVAAWRIAELQRP